MTDSIQPQKPASDLHNGFHIPKPPRRFIGSISPRRSFAIAALLFAACLVAMLPFGWMAITVSKPTIVAFSNPPVWSWEPTAEAFIDLWQGTMFYKYLLNTTIVALISTTVALIIGIPAAYALSRFPSWISAVLLVLALVFRALPRPSVMFPMYEISQNLGIYDSVWAISAALIAINQPFSIWLLRNFFAEIPRELDEAAMIDGCSRLQTLRKIILPIMGPGILTAGIFMFLFAFQEYFAAVILTNAKSGTVPVFIASQFGQTLPMLQQAGAATMFLTLPVVAIAFLAQKYLVAGLSSGSVKG